MDSFFTRFLLTLVTMFSFSCNRLYFGSPSVQKFSLIQPDSLGPVVSTWEDGLRTSGQNKEFEWWYFDAKLDNGDILVAYFYKVHFIGDQYFIGFNYTDNNGQEFFKMKYFKSKEVSFSADSCNVTFGNNYFRGNLQTYEINLDPNDFDGTGFNIKLESTLKPYRPQDGIIKAGTDYFAWLAAVPNGNVDGIVTIDNKPKKVTGSGYHDHNWGNTALQNLFDGWVWFRGNVKDKTIVAAVLYITDYRGGYDIPILYIANKDGAIVNRFGEDGLFSKKSDRITDIYSEKNEPLFKTMEMITEDGYRLKIKGKNVLENITIFKRMGLPFPIRYGMSLSKIDPYYSRYNSKLTLIDKEGNKTEEGFGVYEIMDLR